MEFYTFGFRIGPFVIRYYSLVFLAAILIATWLSARHGKKRGIAPETVWDAMLWPVIGGIIGARLWHVMLPSQSSGMTFLKYLQNPIELISIWHGGLGIPGAVIGGCVGLWFYCRKYGFRFMRFADTVAPFLALAQAIGRLGNYFNQELYGAPTNLPWAITIDPPYRLPQYAEQATYHPLFLYELIYNLFNMALLLWVDKRYFKQLRDGDIFFLYLVIYPLGRFFLEFLRLDTAMVGGLNMNQVIMAIVAIASAVILLIRHRRKPAER